MKIKRFFAAELRQAMRMVKDELGNDAVILSNKRVNGGVELIAAMDYQEEAIAASLHAAENPQPRRREESLEWLSDVASREQPLKTREQIPAQVSRPAAAKPAKPESDKKEDAHIIWSQEPTLVHMQSELKTMRDLLETQLASFAYKDFQAQSPYQFEVQQRLAKMGIGAKLAHEVVTSLPNSDDIQEMWRRVLGKLAVSIKTTEDDILSQGGVVALVGPTGVGKTTTIAKLAARYAKRHGARSVALVSTDNFRIGALEQLKAYARILDVPFRFADSAESLQSAIDYFCERRLILIDTAGMSQRDLNLTQRLSVLQSVAPVRSYLVASATSRLSGLEEVVQAFKNIELAGCFLTKTDESTSLGQALDVVIRYQLPVAYVSDGQRVPEDLQPARSHTLVSRAVAIMKENTRLLDNEVSAIRLGEVG